MLHGFCPVFLRFLFRYTIAITNPIMAIIIEESIVQVTIVAIITVRSLSREPVERRIHKALYTHHQLLQNVIGA